MEQKPLSSVLETTKQDKECSRNTNTIHETSIWTKSMLIALDNGVKGGKWFSLRNLPKTILPKSKYNFSTIKT